MYVGREFALMTLVRRSCFSPGVGVVGVWGLCWWFWWWFMHSPTVWEAVM